MWKRIINKSIIEFENKRILTKCQTDETLKCFNIKNCIINLTCVTFGNYHKKIKNVHYNVP